MNKATVILFSILGVVVLLGVIATTMIITTRDQAVFAKNKVESSFETIGTRLQQRSETMQILINGIDDANEQIADLLEMITDARTALANATTPDEYSEAEGDLEGAFEGLRIIIEDNPGTYQTVDLYNQYMASAVASTNAVTFARETYNDNVEAYRNTIESFPGNLILGMFGFTADAYDYYSAPEVVIPSF